MKQHILDSYKDGFKRISFCRVCGNENPTGECAGRLVSQKKDENVENKVDKELCNL